MSNEKGNFSADISQRAIEEALRSVERREKPAPTDSPDEAEQEASSADVSVESESSELTDLRAQLELSLAKGREMMDRVKDSHERMLRAAADLDNFKKRAAREREEAQRSGIEKLLKDFLPVMDNLERALSHAEQSSDLKALVKGVQMTRRQFEDALGKSGVKGFSAVGKAFDPRLHEAMQQQETQEVPPNHVVAEHARGYLLNDRLIRPAMVVVSAAPPAIAAVPEPSEAPAAEAAEASELGGSEVEKRGENS